MRVPAAIAAAAAAIRPREPEPVRASRGAPPGPCGEPAAFAEVCEPRAGFGASVPSPGPLGDRP